MPMAGQITKAMVCSVHVVKQFQTMIRSRHMPRFKSPNLNEGKKQRALSEGSQSNTTQEMIMTNDNEESKPSTLMEF